MAYLLDSDWAIEAISGNRRVTRTLDDLSSRPLAVSWITLAEVYEGAYSSPNPEARAAAYREFFLPFRRLAMNEDIAARFARLRPQLRRHRNLIPDFDLMQTTIALHYDLTLLTFNLRRFERIPDLRIYPPT